LENEAIFIMKYGWRWPLFSCKWTNFSDLWVAKVDRYAYVHITEYRLKMFLSFLPKVNVF